MSYRLRLCALWTRPNFFFFEKVRQKRVDEKGREWLRHSSKAKSAAVIDTRKLLLRYCTMFKSISFTCYSIGPFIKSAH